MYVIFFTMGVVTGIHPLVFALAKENFPNKIAGTVVAGTNTLIMLGGLLFQPLVGLILDISHKSLDSNGFQVYAANDYSLALSIVPIALVICLCVLHFIKDTGAELAKKDEFEEQLEQAMLNPEVVYD